MLYCSYDQYAAAGGSMTEQSFTVLCARASRLIDGLTFGRAEPHAKACESCRSALTNACVQIVELLAAQQTTGSVPGAVSVNNDGYAVTFAAGRSQTSAAQAETAALLQAALGADPHGLLYRGCI